MFVRFAGFLFRSACRGPHTEPKPPRLLQHNLRIEGTAATASPAQPGFERFTTAARAHDKCVGTIQGPVSKKRNIKTLPPAPASGSHTHSQQKRASHTLGTTSQRKKTPTIHNALERTLSKQQTLPNRWTKPTTSFRRNDLRKPGGGERGQLSLRGTKRGIASTQNISGLALVAAASHKQRALSAADPSRNSQISDLRLQKRSLRQISGQSQADPRLPQIPSLASGHSQFKITRLNTRCS